MKIESDAMVMLEDSIAEMVDVMISGFATETKTGAGEETTVEMRTEAEETEIQTEE